MKRSIVAGHRIGRTESPPRRAQRARRAGRTRGRRWAARGSGGWSGSSYSAWHAAHILNSRHGSLRAVVGNAARDGEARAAIGAVEKGIAIAAVLRIEQLAQTVGARRRVGGNAGAHLAAGFAGDDAEVFFSPWRNALGGSRESMRESGGASACSRRRKDSTRSSRPLDFDGDAAGIVADEAGEPLLRREPVDERPKADALHDAAHSDRLAPQQPSGRSGFGRIPSVNSAPRSGISIAHAGCMRVLSLARLTAPELHVGITAVRHG